MKLRTLASRLLQLALVGLALAALSLHVEGCTAIGFILGSEADLHHGTGGPALLLDIQVGRKVGLRTWDGRTLEGRFAGWSRDSSLASTPGDTASLRGRLVRLGTRTGEIAVPAVDIAEVTTSAYGATIISTLMGFGADVMVIRSLKDDSNSRCGASSGSLPKDFLLRRAPASGTGRDSSKPPHVVLP